MGPVSGIIWHIERAMVKWREEAIRRRATICIWCGKVCKDLDDLEIHEDECSGG